MVQRGLAVIPKSTTPSRLKENINIFDFDLDDEEMKTVDKIAIRVKLYQKFWDGM